MSSVGSSPETSSPPVAGGLDFRGRNVVITGGTGALGRSVLKSLVELGAVCHVPYLSREEAEALSSAGDGRVRLVGPVDLSDEADVARAYEGAGPLWASIHLAGGFAMAPAAATGRAALLQQMDLNFFTAYLCSAAAVRQMAATGGGRIVNVAARPGVEWRLGAGMTAYAASKAAVAAFTTALAAEVSASGILVNAVAPSIIDTPANRQAMPDADPAPWPKPDEVAANILWLASPANRITSGAVVPVYGRC